MTKTAFIIRDEISPERRTPLTPDDVKELVNSGHEIFVISAEHRQFSDNQYLEAGATIIGAKDLENVLNKISESGNKCIFLGVKDSPKYIDNIKGITQMYLALVHRDQQTTPGRIINSIKTNQNIVDIEFLLDEDDKRIAHFGGPAGYNSAAIGIITWCRKKLGQDVNRPIEVSTRQKLLEDVRNLLEMVKKEKEESPDFAIMGPGGNSGGGALKLLQELGIKDDDITFLPKEETMAKDKENWQENLLTRIKERQIFINCIYIPLEKTLPPLLTQKDGESNNRLEVVTDCTCALGKNNPIFAMEDSTTFAKPVLPIGNILLANVHRTPSLTPLESTEYFSEQLFKFLECIDDEGSKEFAAMQKTKDMFDARIRVPKAAFEFGKEIGENYINNNKLPNKNELKTSLEQFVTNSMPTQYEKENLHNYIANGFRSASNGKVIGTYISNLFEKRLSESIDKNNQNRR